MKQKSKLPLILTSVFSITLASCISFQSYHHDSLVLILGDFVEEYLKSITDPKTLKIDSIDWIRAEPYERTTSTTTYSYEQSYYKIRFDYINMYGVYDGLEYLGAFFDKKEDSPKPYFWYLVADLDISVAEYLEEWQDFYNSEYNYESGSFSEQEIQSLLSAIV
jgi:hypothetical protein